MRPPRKLFIVNVLCVVHSLPSDGPESHFFMAHLGIPSPRWISADCNFFIITITILYIIYWVAVDTNDFHLLSPMNRIQGVTNGM